MPCAWLLTAREPLPPIHFSVPYRCADGTAYVIERCVAGRREEICYFRIEKNGQVEKEVYNVRSQLTGWMKACPVLPGCPIAITIWFGT